MEHLLRKYRSLPICSALLLSLLFLMSACSSSKKSASNTSGTLASMKSTVVIKKKVPAIKIDTKNVSADAVVQFSKTLLGVPYKYGSMKKENGFDCSGFINYVFNHFKVKVPRTTVDFTNAGKEVPIEDSKEGDLILFTGSDAKSGVVGHMGLVTKTTQHDVFFIHAASGGGKGVMISSLNSYFIPRFVKVIRVF